MIDALKRVETCQVVVASMLVRKDRCVRRYVISNSGPRCLAIFVTGESRKGLPCQFPFTLRQAIASRSFMRSTHGVLCWTPISRDNWTLPFTELTEPRWR